MASQKLTDLTVATSTGTGDKFYVVQGGVDKQVDFDNMPSGGGGDNIIVFKSPLVSL